MTRPNWLIKMHNPGGFLWWPGYLAWKWFNLCWTAHSVRRVDEGSECAQFWSAEADLLDLKRHPGLWEEARLTTPPDATRHCVMGNVSFASGEAVVTNTTTNGYTLNCLCGRH